ncbi:hypothetical protein SAMN05518672_102727 [Chitinophaga sp. CF118]|uniref:hypothetical protein n=1 Tax=Chitinophaga sp. CF118 TaxID=1884367 RepID=UPI0008E5DD55|nr:hypothetical protein [Chitinophaga sp. CF118]SFD63659.1 hypothetical protein SAMN05518672_102727 [Chitinophaga sp. CF118]
MQRALIANWIPYRLTYAGQDEWIVKWLDLGSNRMIKPFFDETIQICRIKQRERSSLESLCNIDFMLDACKDLISLEPASFIFHVSRCGSTLISQAFSSPEENIVIAEAPLLDEILRAAEKQPEIGASRETWFKAAVKAMGQKRNFRETDYLIKLDSWHIHFYDLLREWYPQTPFFFLYRRPDEVIASHDKRRGIHAVPGMIPPALLKTNEPAHFGADFNRYTAQVLEQYYSKMQDICRLNHPNNFFFDYADGSNKMMEAFSQFTGISIKDSDQMNLRLKYHSKSSQEVFKPDALLNNEKFFFEDCHKAYEELRSLTS